MCSSATASSFQDLGSRSFWIRLEQAALRRNASSQKVAHPSLHGLEIPSFPTDGRTRFPQLAHRPRTVRTTAKEISNPRYQLVLCTATGGSWPILAKSALLGGPRHPGSWNYIATIRGRVGRVFIFSVARFLGHPAVCSSATASSFQVPSFPTTTGAPLRIHRHACTPASQPG